jgi:hypothetical protein
MSGAKEVWLTDEAEEALALLCSTGTPASEAVSVAIVEAAARTNLHPLVRDPAALERALDKSHDVIAEILNHRPPR